MELEPQSIEEQFRIARLKTQLKDLDREELEEYCGRLLEVSSKLTHQTKQLLQMVMNAKKFREQKEP